jgi:hypothetical protein
MTCSILSLQLVFVFAGFFITQATNTLKETPPCWCESLEYKIAKARSMMIERYGLPALESAAVYSSSGRGNRLAQRLKKSLDKGVPFRIGSLGIMLYDCIFATFNIIPI